MKNSKYAIATVIVIVAAALAGGVLYYLKSTATTTYCQSGGGVFSSCPYLTLSASTCTHGIGGNVTGSGYCILSLTNTGASATYVTGCTLFGAAGVSGAGSSPPPVVAAEVNVLAGTNSSAPVNVVCSGSAGAIVQGAAVNGALILYNLPPLAFSAIAS